MADVATYVQRLTNASTGHETRSIMCEGLDYVNNNGLDAQTFWGLTEAGYAKDSDMKLRLNVLLNRIMKDTTPSATSDNLLMTQGIRSILGSLNEYPS